MTLALNAMNMQTLLRCTISILLLSSTVVAQEIPVEAPIQSVGLFKNGLAVVDRAFEVKGVGTYVLSELPEAVHGTFHVECAAPFRLRVRVRDVEVEANSVSPSQPQADLAGKRVSVTMEGPEGKTHSGEVRGYAQESDWSRDYQDSNRPWWSRYRFWSNRSNQHSQYLVLESSGGSVVYLKNIEITSILVHDGQANTVMVTKPILQIEVLEGAPKSATPFRISYLAKGLGWAPSYRAELLQDDRLKLTQNVVLKNELADFQGAQVSLISGFPSVRFSHVEDPMVLGASWSEFFAQLSYDKAADNGGVMSQTFSISSSSRDRGDALLPAPEKGSKGGVHYHPVPGLDMKRGDSLYFSAATKEVGFNRSVHWIIREERDEYGRIDNSVASKMGDNEPWNSITFQNPFEFPMTTAPATVFHDSRFLAQSQSNWVGVGAMASLPISRATEITNSHQLTRSKTSEDGHVINGVFCYQWNLQGSLSVTNNQSNPVKIMIQRQFAGELVQADGEPVHRKWNNKNNLANPQNSIEWNITLKSGESRHLTYKYTSFIRH